MTDRQGGLEPDPSPPWVWALLVAIALLTLTAGAVVGMVTTKDEGPAAAEPASSAATADAPSPTTDVVVPPTVSVPPITETFPETGVTDVLPPITDPGATVTVPPTTPTVPPAAGTWPAGRSGYTVVLASVAEAQGRTEADAAVQRATTAGLSQVGVLRSSDFSSLRPGYWVAYSGVYDTAAQARAALAQASASGFPGAYPRQITP